MLIGHITSGDDALLPIGFPSNAGILRREGVVDTGFNGSVSVPLSFIRRIGWIDRGTETYELANGKRVSERIYLGDVLFDGRRRRVLALGNFGHDILIGTRLLAGRICEFDYVTRMVRIRRGGVLRRSSQ